MISFLRKKNRLINSVQNSDKKPSHLFMDQGRLGKTYAGKFRVELKDMPHFRAAIISDIVTGTLHPVVDCWPDVYNLAVDYDFKTERRLTEDEKHNFARTAQAAVKAFIGTGHDEHRSIVCLVHGEARMCKKNPNLFKDGIHQHWPELRVNHAQAAHLVTKAILPAMEQYHSSEGIDWKDTLDASIYNGKGKGLRPIYTLKCELCDDCLKIEAAYRDRRKDCAVTCKFGKPCNHCNPELRINKACTGCQGEVVKPWTKHHYRPSAMLDHDGVVDEDVTRKLKEDLEMALESTSIIPPAGQPLSFTLPCVDTSVQSNKRKATTPATAEAAAKRHSSSKQRLTSDDVEFLYRKAGGTLQLQEVAGLIEGTVSWRELSPGHDGRPCLCPDCKGAMHSDNAMLTDTERGLLYTCMSTKNQHYLTSQETELELCQGGDRGLAKLVAQKHKGAVVNVSGDNQDATFYVFDERTCLWTHSYASMIKATVIPCVVNTLQWYGEKFYGEKRDRENDLKELGDDIIEQRRLTQEIERLQKLCDELYATKKALDNNAKLSSVLQILQHEVRDDTFKDKLDKQKDIFSIKAGVIDLRTGVLRKRTREDYCSFAVDMHYDPQHPLLPMLTEKMTEITLADRLKRPEYLDYLQRSLGYSVTGETFLEICMVWFGSGANGKSLLAEWLEKCFDQYYCTGSEHLMAKSKQGTAGGTTSHLMVLEGRRVVTIEEMPAELDAEQIKRASGGGKITGRQLHQQQRSFEQTAKLLGLTNHMPVIEGGNAVKRRVKMFPFDAKFYYEEEADEKIKYDSEDVTHFVRDDSLKGNVDILPAFFAWVIEGARLFYESGLGETPECCDTLRREFEQANDKVQSWINNSCDIADEKGLYSAPAAYQSYKSWMENSREIPVGKHKFYEELQLKGYTYKKYQGDIHEFKNKMCFFGLKKDECY